MSVPLPRPPLVLVGVFLSGETHPRPGHLCPARPPVWYPVAAALNTDRFPAYGTGRTARPRIAEMRHPYSRAYTRVMAEMQGG